MRVNVDSPLFGDVRLKMLARALGIPANHAIGCLVAVWHAANVRLSDVMPADAVDAAADVDAFAHAMIRAELADNLGDGTVRLRGVQKRITYLLDQRERSKKANETRWGSRSGPKRDAEWDPRRDTNGIPGAIPHQNEPTSPISCSSPDPALAPDQGAAPLRAAAKPRDARQPTPTAADLAAHLLESIRSHTPDFDDKGRAGAWALELDVGLRAGTTAADFRRGIDFAHRDPRGTFWRGNVLGAKKLREKLDTLLIQDRERQAPARGGRGLAADELFGQIGLRVVGGGDGST